MKTGRLLLALLLAPGASLAVKPDQQGCKDHPLFPTRMPNYRIERCETKEFEAYAFRLGNGKSQKVEGKYTFITYTVDDAKDAQSAAAVLGNYENALAKIGGKVEGRQEGNLVTGSVVVDGREAWVEAQRGNSKIWLRVVERQAMQQHVTANAASFANDIRSTGHVAVYGIYFDTNRSDLKPESTPALEEIARLLKADPALRIWVVGHTDATGNVDSNMRLSQARAEAVVGALTARHGIAAARLKGYGVGPLAPVATNDTEEGKAKNRRVDLVKQ